MSQEQKNPDWQPSADIETLKKRAEIIKRIRQFFYNKDILEVETQLLSKATVTDVHLHSFKIENHPYYLQTSPEFAMKRLLGAGSGPIFQLCKAFRDDEIGKNHNPEFTMLEWYRPGFDHHDLMDEMDEFLSCVIDSRNAERISYQDLFLRELDIDPHKTNLEALQKIADVNIEGLDKDDYLNLILSHKIEPTLGQECPTFIYDYPASQATLSKIRQDNPPVAERFEVYIKGIELANGFHELIDADEQRLRFENDLEKRKSVNLPSVLLDERLLAGLTKMPPCAGVALGIDRLMMIALGKNTLEDVISFSFDKA